MLARYAPLTVLVLVVGLLAGLSGGLIALQLDDDPAPAPMVTIPPAPTPPPTETERLQAAITEVSPAIVRVLVLIGEDGGERAGELAVGSGIVVDDRGLVLTNYHVIEDAESIAVELSTGEQRLATLVADDSPFQDVALLGIDPGGLRAARIGDVEALRIGDPVIAISAGVTTGLVDSGSNQVKRGIISNTDISLDRGAVILERMLQTDAAVNIGDSGGALVNIDGEVVGLLTAVLRVTASGDIVDGVGFAHRVDTVMPVIASVQINGFSARPRYGIERVEDEHLPMSAELQELFDLPASTGALIIAVAEGSPAATAGVLAGDIVTAVNGVPVEPGTPLPNLLAAGGDVELTVIRDGVEERFIVQPGPLALTTQPTP